MATKNKKVSELEDLKEIKTEKEEIKKTDGKTVKVEMLRTVCRADGSFQLGRRYEIPESLSKAFIESRFAEEVK